MTSRIVVLDEVPSTNVEVKRAIDAGEPEGLVIRARRQSGGYGRQGRSWESPEGGLYFSMLLRPTCSLQELPTLALAVGLAVRRALAGAVAPGFSGAVKVKWPNDVVVDAKAVVPPLSSGTPADARPCFLKLCGISCEVHRKAVCVGVGVNVLPVQTGDVSAVAQGKNKPAYLADLAAEPLEAGDPCGALLDRILAEFGSVYDRWLESGFASLVDEYAACEVLRGGLVQVVDIAGGSLASGTVEGVSSDGRLMVRGEDGSVVAVASGEAHIV